VSQTLYPTSGEIGSGKTAIVDLFCRISMFTDGGNIRNDVGNIHNDVRTRTRGRGPRSWSKLCSCSKKNHPLIDTVTAVEVVANKLNDEANDLRNRILWCPSKRQNT